MNLHGDAHLISAELYQLLEKRLKIPQILEIF
jgi:hypothetical protein